MESPRNPFEILFREAAQNPAKEQEFYAWVKRQEFIAPCQQVDAPEGAALVRRLDPQSPVKIRLKAFNQNGVWIVPFFSDLGRFEAWSAPDPRMQYMPMQGRLFFSMVPAGSAALLNPGSEEFSKWFSPEEMREFGLAG